MLFACAIFLAGSVTCVGSRRARLRKANGISGAHCMKRGGHASFSFCLLPRARLSAQIPLPARVSAVYLSF